MRKHPILTELYGFEPQQKELAIVWLGQNGFLIKSTSGVFFFDPYLSDFAEQWTHGWSNEHVRIHSIPIQPKEIYGVDWVFCSHDHVDHIDPFTIPIIALRNPDTKFITPKVAENRMTALYVEKKNLFLMRGDDSIKVGPLKIFAIPAAHSKLDYDEKTGHPYLSYIVQIDGFTILHAGDTVAYEGQAEKFKPFKIDLAFLPINGRKAPDLEMEPNFNINEAIQLAQTINAGMVVPMHYDMYTLNTAPIAEFINQAKDKINYRIAQMGTPFTQQF
jgi:L-ascorbate 6-phosphate lactonase